MKFYCLLCNKQMKKPETSISVLTERENPDIFFVCHRKDCMRQLYERQAVIVGSQGMMVTFAAGKGIKEGWLSAPEVWDNNLDEAKEIYDGPLVLDYGHYPLV